MIDEITITNLYTEAELEFKKEHGNSFLLETDGISWGETDATHSSYVNLTGIGDIITSTKLNTRSIAITGRVCSAHTNREISEIYDVTLYSEIIEKKLEEIEASKKLLSQLVNPTHYLRISHNDYYIDGKPTASVTFSDKWKENNEIFCRFTFSLECNDPMFHYKTSSETPLSGTYHGFHFPLHIPKPRGMHFGEKISYQLLNVNNSGDVSLGGVICIKANGTVNSPTFTNVETNETIKIHKTLSEKEIVKIDTVNRKVTGSTDGENYVNYFSYWDFDNVWFQFDIGDTLFGFSTDDDTYRNMDVWVEINRSYYSLEDQ